MPRTPTPRISAALPILLALLGAPRPSPADDQPDVKAASDEGKQAIAKFRVPEGLKVELFAAEPLVANPVAFGIDAKNRFYVVETFRHSDGVTDTRGHMNWLDDDLAIRTVEDRVAMYRKYLSTAEFARFGTQDDRVRLVEDRDGDGTADHATVFADGFRDPATGLGAGVLARGGDVYYTCIPDLWVLRDRDGDGVSDERTSLARGFGLHVGFLGHDLHGLIFGPDGKLYFSIGDRGFNITTADGRTLAVPDSGSVLRCNPDGTQMEVVATGLRNPQELAFDEYGNLFTVDNNSDSGDRARLVWLVEGGDSGWRIGYQFIEQPNARGPWNAEKMWHPQNADQPAFLVPPLANMSDGPSGLAYNPGTGLRERDRGRFFLADFRGSSGSSGVRSFSVRPKGASFELADLDEFLWGLEATDVDFGTDGSLYVSDWVEGWDKTGKGRIYKVSDPATTGDGARAEVKRLLAEGMKGRSFDDLLKLLGHADMRVRQAAQFAVAEQVAQDEAKAEYAKLWDIVRHGKDRLARIHAIWAFGQHHVAKGMLPMGRELLADTDPEIRVQGLRIASWNPEAWDPAETLTAARAQSRAEEARRIAALYKDESPRVRFFAAQALAKLAAAEAFGPTLEMLRENADADPYLRQAGSRVLARFPDASLTALAGDRSASIRLAAVLALRLRVSPEVARFLADADPRVVTEAARAVNDVPIEGATEKLAALEVRPDTPLPLLRRVVNANVRVGGAEAAKRLAAIASGEAIPGPIRVDALGALADWGTPSGRDRVTGLWRPVETHRASDGAREALAAVVGPILDKAPESVRRAAVEAVAALKVSAAAADLGRIALDKARGTETRISALQALDALEANGLVEIVDRAVRDDQPRIRAEARRILARLDPARAIAAMGTVLLEGSVAEKQVALETLGTMKEREADDLIAGWLDRLLAGEVQPEIRLDLLEAAAKRPSGEVKERLAKFEAGRSADDPLAPFRETLAGGDPRRGGRIFREKAEVSCLRCHKVRGEGGEVGPDLTGIGSKKPPEYFLQSIVAPNATIAEGFETIVVATTDGQVVAGVPKGEDAETLKLMTPEAKLVAVAKSDIEDRKRGDSAMPADVITKLSKQEIRDLIAFLATLK